MKWDDWLDNRSPETIVAHYAQHPDHTVCCILDERLIVLDADTPLAVSALDILEQKFGVESNFVVNTRRGSASLLPACRRGLSRAPTRTAPRRTPSESTSRRGARWW